LVLGKKVVALHCGTTWPHQESLERQMLPVLNFFILAIDSQAETQLPRHSSDSTESHASDMDLK